MAELAILPAFPESCDFFYSDAHLDSFPTRSACSDCPSASLFVNNFLCTFEVDLTSYRDAQFLQIFEPEDNTE